MSKEINITYRGNEVSKGIEFAEKLTLEGYDVTTEDCNPVAGARYMVLRATRPLAEDQRQPRHTLTERPQLIQG